MMEYKDFNGIPIKIGDFVIGADSRSFSKAIVIGFTPTMVRTGRGLYGPAQLMISTEQFQVAGKSKWMDEQREKYKDQLDPSKPIEKPKVSWRYLVAVVTDEVTKNKFGIVMKLDATTQDRFRDSKRDFFKTHGYSDSDAYFIQSVYKGYQANSNNRYVEEFDKGYSYYNKGYSLTNVKNWGMVNLIDARMPVDQFITSFPNFNLAKLRSDGKI